MAKRKKNKRRSMKKGTRRASQEAKTGVSYLNLPKGMKLFKEDSKRYRLDVLPYVVKNIKKHSDAQNIESDIWWRLPFKVHKNIGPDRKDIVCPRTIGRKCKICEDRQKLYNDPHGDEEVAKLLKAKDRVLYYVIPRKSKDFENKPHLWEISYFCFGKELDKEIDYEEDYAGFADPEDGYTLDVRFATEKLGKNSFIKCDRIDFRKRDDIDDEVFEDLPDLMDCLVILSKEEIDAIYDGIDDVSGYDDDKDEEDDDDEDIDDIVDEEDDEDDDEDDDDEEDEEDELTADDIFEMKKKELNKLVKENKLKIKAKDKNKIKEYRKAVISALDLNEDEDEDEEECPHGYEFGVDNGEYDECDDCDNYDECLEASD